ncbi:MAG: hypothetical protein M3Y31_08495, partial [Gemmatimonadota bacterium]|nr:hypothetical protein [Gemmatimonadota bacterium]
MRSLTLLLLAAAAPSLAPESATAQAPPERAALAALRDSVADVDAGVIERLRAGASRGSLRSGNDTLRLALLERRLAETSGTWSWLDSAEVRVERLLRDD